VEIDDLYPIAQIPLNAIESYQMMVILISYTKRSWNIRANFQLKLAGSRDKLVPSGMRFRVARGAKKNRTAPHGGVIFALKMVKNTGIYSVL